MSSNPSPLKFVALWNSHMTAIGVGAIVKSLQSSSNVVSNIDIGSITEDTVADLAELLTTSKTLRKLICMGERAVQS